MQGPNFQNEKPVRLTLYADPAKDFALRYLAFRKRTSLNELLSEALDNLLAKENIVPADLPKELP